MWNIVILAIFILLASPVARAESPVFATITTQDDARPLTPAVASQVDTVIDATRIRLKDGRIVQLSGIEIPAGTMNAPSTAEENAKKFLDEFFKDPMAKDVLLYQTPKSDTGRITRMGHELMHMVRKHDHIWVQGALLRSGLARAWPVPSNPELADKMFAEENLARTEKLGLWVDDSAYKLLDPDTALNQSEGFAVVEGTVKSVATVNNMVYLNFGPDWKKDFTVGIPAPVRQAMSRQGMDVFKFQGQVIRVRGWMRPYNGPFIELESPLLLEYPRIP